MGTHFLLDLSEGGYPAALFIQDWSDFNRQIELLHQPCEELSADGSDAELDEFNVAYFGRQQLLDRSDAQLLRAVFQMCGWSFDPSSARKLIAEFSVRKGVDLLDAENMPIHVLADALARMEGKPLPSQGSPMVVAYPQCFDDKSLHEAFYGDKDNLNGGHEELAAVAEPEAVQAEPVANGSLVEQGSLTEAEAHTPVRAHQSLLFPMGADRVDRGMVELIVKLDLERSQKSDAQIIREYYANSIDRESKVRSAPGRIRSLRSRGLTNLPPRQ